jgi:glycosyltransferase involved in cell wall biosynthesis
MELRNIVIVNDTASITGGAAKVALSSALALLKRGFSVILFSAVPPVMPEFKEKYTRVVLTGQHEILTDPSRTRALMQGIWNIRAAAAMEDLLDTLDPADSIVHIHSWTKALSSSVVRKALEKGFHAICTLHDYFIACPNGGFFHYRHNQICQEIPMSLRCIMKNCDMRSYQHKIWRILRQIVQRSAGYMPNGIRHFISVSDASLDMLRRYIPKYATVYRIGNPVDIAKRDPVAVENNELYFSVGRLSREKGHILFARALSALGIKGAIIGSGECRGEIASANPWIRLLGWHSHNEVQEYLRTARALIFPSLCYETQGLAVLEAAAMGIPAIVPDTSAARDCVVNGVTGLWFRGGDVHDLEEKMRCIDDKQTARDMGKSAYEWYWGNPMTMEIYVDKLIETYSHILDKPLQLTEMVN